MTSTDLVMISEDLELDARLGALYPDLDHGRALSRAALAGDLDLAFLEREFAMPPPWKRARNMPLVAVIVDTVGRPAGPATWRSAAALANWADIAILHRAGAEKRHYSHAAELAKTHLRTLLIEAPAETFDGWLALLQRRAGLAVEVMELRAKEHG